MATLISLHFAHVRKMLQDNAMIVHVTLHAIGDTELALTAVFSDIEITLWAAFCMTALRAI